MGNSAGLYDDDGFYGYGGYYDNPMNNMRSSWNPISQSAKNKLEEAKDDINKFLFTVSFNNILKYHKHYSPTDNEKKKYALTAKKIERIKNIDTSNEVIKYHIVSKLRPKLNQYVKNFDCYMKWRELTANEKSLTKYKKQKRTIYFGTLHFNYKSRSKLIKYLNNNNNFNTFNELDELAESCLFSKLRLIGVPAIDSIGWIKNINININNGKISNEINNIEYAKDINIFIDHQCKLKKVLQTKYVETFPNYINEYSKYNLTIRKLNKEIANGERQKEKSEQQQQKIKEKKKEKNTNKKIRNSSKKSNRKQQTKLSFVPSGDNSNSNTNSNRQKHGNSNNINGYSSILGVRQRSNSIGEQGREFMPPSSKRRMR